MPQILDYETPRAVKRAPLGDRTWALIVSAIAHCLIFITRADTSNGLMLRICVAVSLGYWAVALMMIARRRHQLTWPDLLFIALGYPVMFHVCIAVLAALAAGTR